MRFKPYPYQKEAARRIVENTHYGLFLDMGLGKTASTLYALDELMFNRFEVQKVLIVAPPKVAESTWQDDISKFSDFKDFRVHTLTGTPKQREKLLEEESGLFIIGDTLVSWLCRKYNYSLPFDMLVIDESSRFKSPQTQKFKALRKARSSFSRIVILTGTPSPNSLEELWPQLYLLDGGERLGKTLTQYRNAYFKPNRTNGHVVFDYRIQSEEARQTIYRKIDTICMSLEAKDYLTMPDRIDNVIALDMPQDVKKRYAELKRDMVLELDGEDITAVNAAAVSNKLLQMANGCLYTDEKETIRLHDVKIEALQDIVDCNPGKPVLVFYSFLSDKERILESFPNAKVLQGKKDMQDWNDGKIEMLIAHPASCSYGLNLQYGGNIVIWYGLTWSLEQYLQANARLYRQGQKETVVINHLVMKGTIDEQVMKALQRKEVGQRELIEALKANLLERKGDRNASEF